MKKVYLVTEGEYSDYRVLAVFSSRNRANQYKNEVCGDTRVEEYELDIPKKNWHLTCIVMNREGEVLNTFKEITGHYYSEGFNMYDRYGDIMYCVATDDEERAIKVVNEKRGKLIAMNAWGNEKLTRSILKKQNNEVDDK